MRGMYAIEDIKSGENFLYVPDHLLITFEKIEETSLGKNLVEKILVKGEFRLISPITALLAIRNLEEISKGEDS